MYHGMTLQPGRAEFAASMPMAADRYDDLDRWAHPAVAAKLGISTIPIPGVMSAPQPSSVAPGTTRRFS